MERSVEQIIERQLSFAALCVKVQRVGHDYQIIVAGGESPHMGSVVMTIPRSSLTGDGSISCTSSVINRVGHEDEKICRILAERVAIDKNAVVVCSGGFHVDKITKEQIAELIDVVESIGEEVS